MARPLCSNSISVFASKDRFGMIAKLTSGDSFPSMSLALAGGGSITLPSDLKTSYSVILFYRGHW